MNGAGGPILAMSPDLRDRLRAAAEKAYPNECCALLIGVVAAPPAPARVTRLVFADNVAPDPRIGFELDPKVLIAVLRALREAEAAGPGSGGGGERLLGHFHSHPDAPARPSAQDRALAHEPGLFWLIQSVERGGAGELNAFHAIAAADGGGDFVAAALVA